MYFQHCPKHFQMTADDSIANSILKLPQRNKATSNSTQIIINKQLMANTTKVPLYKSKERKRKKSGNLKIAQSTRQSQTEENRFERIYNNTLTALHYFIGCLKKDCFIKMIFSSLSSGVTNTHPMVLGDKSVCGQVKFPKYVFGRPTGRATS